MKRFLITATFLLSFSLLKAQDAPAKTDSIAKVGKTTGKIFIDDMGRVYDVFQGKNNSFFVIRVAKNGTARKQVISANLAAEKTIQAPNPEQLASDRK